MSKSNNPTSYRSCIIVHINSVERKLKTHNKRAFSGKQTSVAMLSGLLLLYKK